MIPDNLNLNRREMLRRWGGGLGAMALSAMLTEEVRAHSHPASPLAPREPHFQPRAKRVIFIFLNGGPPQIDTFDPKCRVVRNGVTYASPYRFHRHGQSGLSVSEVFPEVGSCADHLCVIRSMYHEDANHPGGCFLMNCGHRIFSRPSLGAWISYGLGTENENLPAFIALGEGQPLEGARQYGSGFLPAYHQATFIQDLNHPVANLVPAVSVDQQRQELDALDALNRMHAQTRVHDERLNARIASFEQAYRMQAGAPMVFDLTRETEATHRLYGIGDRVTDTFGRQCLLARRLVEHGVRFVEIFDTRPNNFQPWDLHGGHDQGLRALAQRSDKPIAGLLKDLRARHAG